MSTYRWVLAIAGALIVSALLPASILSAAPLASNMAYREAAGEANSVIEVRAGMRRGGAVVGPRGDAVVRRSGAVVGTRGGAYRNRTAVVGPRGNVAVRTTTIVRPGGGGGGVRWARPGYYHWPIGGAVAAGAAVGFVTAASAVAWAGAPPASGMCWYYTDPTRTQGFWDYCPQ